MRAILPLICLILASCVAGPSYTETSPNGTVYHFRSGGTVLGKRENVVADVQGPNGRRVRYVVQREDATEVANTAIPVIGGVELARVGAGVTKHAATTDSATTLGLGAQGVQKEGIRAGVSGATKFNPNIPLPIRQ